MITQFVLVIENKLYSLGMEMMGLIQWKLKKIKILLIWKIY